MIDGESVSVIPAQLGFLTIYNPSLGPTDETLQDQIVFYYSSQIALPSQNKNGESNILPPEDHRDDTNERLRKIGLAQGMGIANSQSRNFSNGHPVDNIETEKSRIVLHELENGWWILASIDLTRILSANTANASSENSTSGTEYSSREVYPPDSLIQQLRRAHSIFLLHHGVSLENLYRRVGRAFFCKLLSRFWNRFIRHWLVLLNGNPATDLFNGVKLAVGGELGIGVGEEEWGSGEREVLEDYVSRTDGLVDLVVSRFGDAPVKETDNNKNHASSAASRIWLGAEQAPRPSDGVIFSGVGAISRQSLSTLSHWMEWIYKYGESAYGVDENPSSTRSRKRRKARLNAPAAISSRSSGSKKVSSKSQPVSGRTSPGIPPPLVVGTPPPPPTKQKSTPENQPTEDGTSGTETFMKYLTLGYGYAWKFPGLSDEPAESAKDQIGNEASQESTSKKTVGDEAIGKFIIGLRDDLEEELSDDEDAGENFFSSHIQGEAKNKRTLLRTLHVEMAQSVPLINDEESSEDGAHKKLQVLVYVHQPFMFTFLFDLHTPSLTLPSFYRSIHHQLGPLKRPLLSSTSPHNVSRRIYLADCDAGKQKRASSAVNNPIYDLVYDPSNLTIRSSIPNIPEPGVPDSTTFERNAPTAPHWSRLEALNVHSQFLSTYTDARTRPLETERTCKTSRGWWLIWVRIREAQNQSVKEDDNNNSNKNSNPPKEAFLIRKASDALYPSSSPGSYAGGTRHTRDASSGIRFLRDLSGASSTATNNMDNNSTLSPGKLTEGLGFDAHQYIESLLSLNR